MKSLLIVIVSGIVSVGMIVLEVEVEVVVVLLLVFIAAVVSVGILVVMVVLFELNMSLEFCVVELINLSSSD